MKKLLLILSFVAFSFMANAQVVFHEDFNSSTSIPTGWVVYEDNLTNYSGYGITNKGWFLNPDFFGTGDNAMLSLSYTEVSAACDRWLVTPAITLNQTGLFLKFKAWGYTDGTYAEKLKVYISTTDQQKASFTTVLHNYSALPSGSNDYLIDLSAYQGSTVYIAFQNYGDGYYVAVDNVEVLVPDEYGVELASVEVPAYVAQGANATVKGTITNKGVVPLQSFDAYFVVNGTQTSNVESFSAPSLAYNASYSFQMTAPFNQTQEGVYTIELVVKNPNGQGDDYNDDASTTTTVYDASAATPRTSLLEQFTTCSCPNCPAAITAIRNAVNGRDDVIWIAHHSGYGTDQMTSTVDNDLLTFYNDGGAAYAPAMMLDRTQMTDDPGPVFFPDGQAMVTNMINQAIVVPSFVTVNIDNYTYNPSTRNLSVTVSCEFLADMAFDSPRLSIYLIEDNLNYYQQGYGNMTHNGVTRKSLIGNTWGEVVATPTGTGMVPAGTTYTKTVEYTLPSNYKANDCRVLAFVSNYTTNVNKRQIYNSTISQTTLGIHDENDNLIDMMVYPNPVVNEININTEMAIDRVEIYNLQGQLVKFVSNNPKTINVSDLASGTYMINIVAEDGVCVKKIVKE